MQASGGVLCAAGSSAAVNPFLAHQLQQVQAAQAAMLAHQQLKEQVRRASPFVEPG